MFERNLANKLKGWNSISDIAKKLNIKKSTAYVYTHKIDKAGFIIQKVKRPRGTMYLIDSIPRLSRYGGMFEKGEIIETEIEFARRKIPPEHKIAYYLSSFKKENNRRYYEQAKLFVRSIKNWKRLYRYIKAYKIVNEFKMFYGDARKNMKKIPRMPKRYKKLIGVEDVS